MKEEENEHTPSLTAFRRKNALHGAHVGAPKLIPTAASQHTRHDPSVRFLDDVMRNWLSFIGLSEIDLSDCVMMVFFLFTNII